MKAYVIFSSKEPVLVVTRHSIRSSPTLAQLARIGIHKFIAREVPLTHLRARYGRQFDVIKEALDKGSPLRVLDFSGHRVFQNLSFSELGPAYRRESRFLATDVSQESMPAPVPPIHDSSSPAVFGSWALHEGIE